MTLFHSARAVRGRALLGALPLLILLLALTPAALAAQHCPRPSGRDIHAIIETDRATYQVGDTIRVRVSLRNVSDVPITFVPYSPWYQVVLVVTAGDGRVVEKRWPGGGGGPPTVTAARLEPGRMEVQLWDGREWLRLGSWGYDLREPGQYAIVGIPQIASPAAAQITGPAVAPDGKTVRSNQATFTIVPRR